MIEIKSPGIVDHTTNTIFMAGSIEMGAAEDWQARVTKAMKDYDITLVNPRRDDWDPTWKQSIYNEKFKEQVDWELENLARASMVIFYFDPNTKSPITLMELGIAQGDPANVLVCCPEGFWRKGNVDIVCYRAHIPVFENLDDLINRMKEIIGGQL